MGRDLGRNFKVDFWSLEVCESVFWPTTLAYHNNMFFAARCYASVAL